MTEQFNLEKYNRLVSEGKTPKIVTRDGRDVRILCTDIKSCDQFVVGALVMEKIGVERGISYDAEGQSYKFTELKDSPSDLFFADPEPTYRPYKDEDECFKDVQKHGFLIRAKRAKVYHLIVTITSSHIWLGGACEGIPMDRLLDEFEYTDGTPCGVKEEEV